MRIAIGSLMHEGNTFVPTTTTVETFAANLLLRGEELLTGYGDARVEVPAFIATLRAAGVEPIPTLAANAIAGGPVEPAAFEQLLGELVERLRAALPLDGVLLALHGAMTTTEEPDAERLILAAARQVVGPDVPVVATLDLHGHLTPEMISAADILVGYLNYPHTDMYETGERAARLLLDTLGGRIQPTLAMAKRPMVVSPVKARTDELPLKTIVDAARAMERAARILHAALFPVQPWLDVPELGFGVLVVTDSNREDAQRAANELAEMAWAARHEFEPDLTPLDEAIRIGLEAESGLTVVGDAGDAPTGGTPADNATVLQALLDAGADRAARLTYLSICDPVAARQAVDQAGQTVTLRVGHWASRDAQPVVVTGTVSKVTDGTYRSGTGTVARMGPTAVLAIGSLRLCIRSLPSSEWDPAMYSSLGLEPREAALIFVKSPSHFRATFGPLADRLLIADTPGATCPNMRRVPFQRVTRPLYPLDSL